MKANADPHTSGVPQRVDLSTLIVGKPGHVALAYTAEDVDVPFSGC